MAYRRLVLCLLATSAHGKQFIYPVGATVKDGVVNIHLMHQKSLEDIELLSWNPVTKVTTKELLSTFSPALFRVMPHGSGFSFIDKDRVLVKSFKKRSPKTITFNDPINEISALEWIDESEFYFMGRRGNRFCIFQSNLQGDLSMIAQHDSIDCMYPQKINQTLFYVERVKVGDEYTYALVSAAYPPSTVWTFQPVPNFDDAHDREIFLRQHELNPRPLINHNDTQRLFNFGAMPVAFLHMVSDTQGFFITHPQAIQRDDAVIPFTHYQLTKAPEGWAVKPLFNFSLPAHFFVSSNEHRIYESLLPFLPKQFGSTFYFADCYDTDRLRVGLFAFDLSTQTVTKASYAPKTERFGDAFFAPLQVNAAIFYGGGLSEEGLETALAPSMWVNDDGLLCVDLPMTFKV